MVDFSQGNWDVLLLWREIKCAIGQKWDLPLIQVNVHELICSLGQECPCDQVLSFWKHDFTKGLECIGSREVSFLQFHGSNQSISFLHIIRGFQVPNFLSQVINRLFQSLCFANLTNFLDVKNLLNGSEELRLYLNFKLNHFHLTSFFVFNWEGDLLFWLFECFDQGWDSNLFEDKLLFKKLWFWWGVNNSNC